ncbi:hypothetical protein [Achromobacter xylosoxidans]|uniref:hypothetical protein n=1 Tax=Alcaligenes xylosoxydans xylosoxydans TaxID=85698 RepID=UPI001F132104|nr:hypothetical protein [Achromobacter xylosoxidans]
MHLDTLFSCNSVVWITSLPEDELGPSNRMAESVEGISTENFSFIRRCVRRNSELEQLLNEVAVRAREDGLRPMLVLDMHGHSENGLSVAEPREFVSWERLAELLREINLATHNNLCVVGAACYALTAIKSLTVTSPAPFFVLFAPEEEVNVGFLESNLPKFLEDVFSNGDVDAAYERHLQARFKYFHCERLLFIAIARYVRMACKGKGAAERREWLMTEVFAAGMPNTPENRRNVRTKIKNDIRPDQGILDRYTATYLIGKAAGFTMDQLLDYVERASTA